MPLVAVSYTPFVLEGRGAGVEISVSDKDPLRIGYLFGPQAMKRRINGMMKAIEGAMQKYVKWQFETSGRGYSRIASRLGLTGGSLEPWKPLSQKTIFERERGYGYYKGLPGSGDDPRMWSGRGLVVSMQAIQATANAVNINIRDAIMAFNEETRPTFVLEEVAQLSKGLAKKFFVNTKGEPVVTDGDTVFDFKVGEKAPFDFGDKPMGRPRLSAEHKALRNLAKGLGLDLDI